MPAKLYRLNATLAALALVASASIAGSSKAENPGSSSQAAALDPPIPDIAPIGAPVDRYLEIPGSALGPPLDPPKGYRTERLGEGLYLITDGSYQSMFMVYTRGVVVVDAPQPMPPRSGKRSPKLPTSRSHT